MASVFRNILVPSQIEEAVINKLITWFPTYLREIERQTGIEAKSLKTPRNYTNRNSFDAIPAEEIPKVVVISPGLLNTPEPSGQGQYRATWRLGIGVATAASTEPEANMLVKAYGSAVRAIMLQQQNLAGLHVAQIRWLDETYDDLPIASQNQLYKAASVHFSVDCEDVVTKRAGPRVPDQDSYVYGEVASVTIDIVKEAIV